MKIVVLAGGLSPERNVSLVSGTGVCRALRELGHRAILVDLFMGVESLPEDPVTLFDAEDGFCREVSVGTQVPDLMAVRASRPDQSPSRIGPNVLELCRLADVVFIGLHGEDGEDGRIQAVLDLMGIPYTGSGHLASAIAMDKAMTKQVMDSVNIPTPAWQLLTYGLEDVDRLTAELPMPCVVKATGGGSSLGVFLPENREELRNALIRVQDYNGGVLVEERIYGRELTIAVLGDRALPAVEILPSVKEFDYTAKYQENGAREICPAPITEAQQQEMGELALRLHRTLGMRAYSRSDFMLDDAGKLWCLEINSLPGMTPTSLVPREATAIGMSYRELCGEILRLSMDERKGE